MGVYKQAFSWGYTKNIYIYIRTFISIYIYVVQMYIIGNRFKQTFDMGLSEKQG